MAGTKDRLVIRDTVRDGLRLRSLISNMEWFPYFWDAYEPDLRLVGLDPDKVFRQWADDTPGAREQLLSDLRSHLASMER